MSTERKSPFRVDQVTAAPGLMAALFVAQLLVAFGLQWAGSRGSIRLWWMGCGAMLLLVAVFFTLGSWGTSDVTKLSHYFEHSLEFIAGEPFWSLVGPLVVALPYRMAAAHGLIVAAYAAALMLLSRSWGVRAWAGWWSLLVTCSPLLRNFLQTGVSRQALATLLLLPLMLWAARLVPIKRIWLGLSVLGSALVHTTFPMTVLISMLPLLARARLDFLDGISMLLNDIKTSRIRSLLALALAVVISIVLIVVVGPIAWKKLTQYASTQSFYNSYAILREVHRLEIAILLGTVLTCWRRQLGWRELVACRFSRVVAIFALLFVIVQASVAWQWYPQITMRFVDTLGLYFLASWLAWLHRYKAELFILPALLVTVHYWLVVRILPSAEFLCGADDQFLCIPDRWPWQITYWG